MVISPVLKNRERRLFSPAINNRDTKLTNIIKRRKIETNPLRYFIAIDQYQKLILLWSIFTHFYSLRIKPKYGSRNYKHPVNKIREDINSVQEMLTFHQNTMDMLPFNLNSASRGQRNLSYLKENHRESGNKQYLSSWMTGLLSP